MKSVIEEQTISIQDLSVTQQADVERKLSVTDEEDLRLLFPEGILSKKESTILLYVYVYGYSSTDIANTWNVSRQNVNQIRKKAEKKLRNAYC
ncbi:sigma factor-like helix-turn-helix DNA-binding protein [Bengtsoniella intestinalis]|uniref:sigma factor-like helix-turn-helix DNA-binding protein n=1 Tax=Bengtsoniella intestinalis TaxID=3073143 RepID=UPI00391EE8A7